MKKGSLNKIERSYIEVHRNDMAVADIAKDLNRSVKSVQSHLDNLPPTADTGKVSRAKSRTFEMLTGRQQGQKNPDRPEGVVVMTRAISERGDEVVKQSPHARHPDAIAKVFNE